jgi:hypothetical protein
LYAREVCHVMNFSQCFFAPDQAELIFLMQKRAIFVPAALEKLARQFFVILH